MSTALRKYPPLIKKRPPGALGTWKRIKKMWMLYLFFLVPLVIYIVFRYLPMYGILIAFKDYSYGRGIWGSPWNRFENFRMLFENPFFVRTLRNTIVISLCRIAFEFPAPIVLAILLNEVGSTPFKRVVQSVSYLPHFVSWVVLAGILVEIVSPQRGLPAYIAPLFGREPPLLLTSTRWFIPMLIVSGIWQSVGWGAIIYLATISTIDPGLYESAAIDGANRFRIAWHVTLPSLVPVITVLFILRLGGILNAGFDQIFNLYNPLVYEVADIIDTFVYRAGIIERRYDFSTAVGLFKNVAGLLLILGANAVIRRVSEYAIW